jgi:hypothetical protein
MMERQSLQRVLENVGFTASESEEQMFSYYAMRQRDVLNDCEWRGYTQ